MTVGLYFAIFKVSEIINKILIRMLILVQRTAHQLLQVGENSLKIAKSYK